MNVGCRVVESPPNMWLHRMIDVDLSANCLAQGVLLAAHIVKLHSDRQCYIGRNRTCRNLFSSIEQYTSDLQYPPNLGLTFIKLK
jgi:hypothetical protein